jgi:transcriptional regulator with XRE-family HTH domain
MNQTIASNIRRHRERRSWSQRHLADAANVNERTVQRAEDGTGLSAETLQAIAGAFDVSVDDLRRNVDAEQVKAALERYQVVRLDVVEHASRFQRLLSSASGLHFECVGTDDAVHDVAAELHQRLRDCCDLWSDLSELQKRDEAKSLFEYVETLAGQGHVIAAGLDAMRLRSEGAREPFDITALYVVVSPRDKPTLFVMRDKKLSVQFV